MRSSLWALILLHLSLVARSDDEFSESGYIDEMNIDESSLRRILYRNAFEPIQIRKTIDDYCQTQYPTTYQCPVQTNEIFDPPIDSLLNSKENVASMLHMLEMKFDRIMDALDFEKDNRMHDIKNVMNILSDMHRYIQRSDDNVDTMTYLYKSGMSQSHSIKELKEEVGLVNKKLRNIELDIDQVIIDIRNTMQTMEEVSYTIQDIDQRTIWIDEASYHHQGLIPNYILNENEFGDLNSNRFLITPVKPQTEWNKDETILGYKNIETDNQLSRNDVDFGHKNPSLTTNSKTQFDENDIVGRPNPSMGLKNVHAEKQLKESDIDIGFNNIHLTTPITNTQTQFNENDIVGSINPSIGLENTKTENEFKKFDVSFINTKPLLTTIIPNNRINEDDMVGSEDPSLAVKNTETENQVNKNDPLTTRTANTQTELDRDNKVGNVNSSTIVGNINVTLTSTTTNANDTRNPPNITTTNRSQSTFQFRKNDTIVGKSNPITNTTNVDGTKNSHMPRTASNITTTTKSLSQILENDTIVGERNPSLVTTITNVEVTRNSSTARTTPNITTTTGFESKLNGNKTIMSKRNMTMTTTTVAGGTRNSSLARNSSSMTTTTKSLSELSENDTIVGKRNPSLVTTTTNVGVTRNSSTARTASNITTLTGAKLNENNTIIGKRNTTMTTTTIVGNNRNSSMAKTPSNIKTTTQSQSQLSTNSTIVGMRNPKLTTTTISTDAQKTTGSLSKQTYRQIRKNSNEATFEPYKSNCHDLTMKRNGIYKFGSQDEVGNEAGRFFDERYCDFSTDNVAWTVIQRRFATNRVENFNRTWMDYKLGFGILNREFWFGNDFIHKLTNDGDMELRIIIEDKHGKQDSAEYSLFKVHSEKNNYKLMIANQRGTFPFDLLNLNGQEFSTYDRHSRGANVKASCASLRGNGWWFKDCKENLWFGKDVFKTSKMMVRPKRK